MTNNFIESLSKALKSYIGFNRTTTNLIGKLLNKNSTIYSCLDSNLAALALNGLIFYALGGMVGGLLGFIVNILLLINIIAFGVEMAGKLNK
ncbi:MAG: hypothetical protein EXR06_00755 [Rickettsiales bacterium]|nr:hypothetical protein [Rickettsiales bacterium]